MKKLEGKVAVVTGSGRGIGREIALKLAREGAAVVVNDLSQEEADEVVATIHSDGGLATGCVGSVVDPDVARRLVADAVSSFGGLDIIVNNAGYTWDGVIQKMSDDQWNAMLDVHLTGPFQILRAAQPVIAGMVKREREEGRPVPCRKVVNVSSIAGLCGNAGQINYAAAKAGVVGLTKALAKEWGRMNVAVNSVAFGLIKTRLTEVADGEDRTIDIEGRKIKVSISRQLLDSAEATIPLRRAGNPEEAAGAVYLLCAPESDYISAHTLVCSGGLMI